jgi:hypothetical protein
MRGDSRDHLHVHVSVGAHAAHHVQDKYAKRHAPPEEESLVKAAVKDDGVVLIHVRNRKLSVNISDMIRERYRQR